MVHEFKINGHNPEVKWGLNFGDGTYQELIRAPKRKVSPLEMNWADEDGVETDRDYNRYESKPMLLPVFIVAPTQNMLLQRYNSFVVEVLLSGGDIELEAEFLNRVFSLRYQEVMQIEWAGDSNVVTFNLSVVDDYPGTITTID